ncbi:hypothetical protein HPB49_009546 [Dermacentor silvarum]|uniref:Uncharacterized protein n=1 Tax=Dermacentor silvarum TaxID=543639 RepID=A0ACB8CQT6_DERSI|nr:hypothetical protein HPB49_009546 [Dermacentor silvarum]
MMHSHIVARKIEVVKWHRALGNNVSCTSRHFKIDRKRICEWDSKYDTLKHLNYGKQKMKCKLTDGGPIFNEELDNALLDYLEMKRNKMLATWSVTGS